MKEIEVYIAILSGTATADDRKLFDNLMTYNESRKVFEQVGKIWNESVHVAKYRNVDTKRAFIEISRKLASKKQLRKRYVLVSMLSTAASILLMLGLFQFTGQPVMPAANENSRIIVQTEQGNRSFVLLPDSTMVWLNSKSQVCYDAEFGKVNREVFIVGEAFFDVAADKKPFIVNVGAFKIKVFGTRFDVSAYPDDPDIYTCLESGKINIQRNTDIDLPVQPGQLVVYHKHLSSFDIKKVDTRQYTSWKENRLYLNAESLLSLSRKLERQYNIDIVFIPEKLGTEIHYTGTFTNESIEEMLEAISMASDLSYKKKGNRYEMRYK